MKHSESLASLEEGKAERINDVPEGRPALKQREEWEERGKSKKTPPKSEGHIGIWSVGDGKGGKSRMVRGGPLGKDEKLSVPQESRSTPKRRKDRYGKRKKGSPPTQ